MPVGNVSVVNLYTTWLMTVGSLVLLLVVRSSAAYIDEVVKDSAASNLRHYSDYLKCASESLPLSIEPLPKVLRLDAV